MPERIVDTSHTEDLQVPIGSVYPSPIARPMEVTASERGYGPMFKSIGESMKAPAVRMLDGAIDGEKKLWEGVGKMSQGVSDYVRNLRNNAVMLGQTIRYRYVTPERTKPFEEAVVQISTVVYNKAESAWDTASEVAVPIVETVKPAVQIAGSKAKAVFDLGIDGANGVVQRAGGDVYDMASILTMPEHTIGFEIKIRTPDKVKRAGKILRSVAQDEPTAFGYNLGGSLLSISEALEKPERTIKISDREVTVNIPKVARRVGGVIGDIALTATSASDRLSLRAKENPLTMFAFAGFGGGLTACGILAPEPEPEPVPGHVIYVDENGEEVQETTPAVSVVTESTEVADTQTTEVETTEVTQQPPTPEIDTLPEWQADVMSRVQVVGTNLTLLEVHSQSEDGGIRESAQRLTELVFPQGFEAALPERVRAEIVQKNPQLAENPLNRDQTMLRVDGVAEPDESTGTVYVYNPHELEIDGEVKTTEQLLDELANAQTPQERQRAVELARASGLLVYTPGEVGGRVQTAVVGNNVIMQRVDAEGNVVQSTDNSALNWKVGLTPEQVALGEDEENPFYNLENVNGGGEEGTRPVFWEDDQKVLPPAGFDTQGLRLSVVDGKPAYVDSEGNTVATLSGRDPESPGNWEMVERTSERVTLPPFTYDDPLVFRLTAVGDQRIPEVRNTLPPDVQHFPGFFTAEEMTEAFEDAGIELEEGLACSSSPNAEGRYNVYGLVAGFRDDLPIQIRDNSVIRNTVFVQICGRDTNGNIVPIVIETAYTITHYPDSQRGRMILPDGREIDIRQKFPDEVQQQLIGTVFTYRGKGIIDGSGSIYGQWIGDMVNPIRGGSEALQTGEYPSHNGAETTSALGGPWIEFVLDGRNLSPSE